MRQYETGFFTASFAGPTDLALEIVKALTGQLVRSQRQVLDPAAAVVHLDRHRWGARRDRRSAWTSGAWLGAAIVPERQGEPYIAVLDLGDPAFRDRLLQPALFGASAVFDRTHGVRDREEADHLVFEQHDDQDQPVASLEVHPDGTLVYGRSLRSDRSASRSLARSYVIDQDEVRRILVTSAAVTPPAGWTAICGNEGTAVPSVGLVAGKISM